MGNLTHQRPVGEALKGYSWQKNAYLETEMLNATPLIEVWRGEFLESQHRGHAVVCNFEGEIIEVEERAERRHEPKVYRHYVELTNADRFGAPTRYDIKLPKISL